MRLKRPSIYEQFVAYPQGTRQANKNRVDPPPTTPPTPSPADDNYLARLVTYIPAEIVAAYMTARGIVMPATSTERPTGLLIAFILCLIITPLYTYWATVDNSKPKPWYHIVVSIVAFATWVFALGDYFKYALGDSYSPKIASLLLLFITMIIPLADRFFLPKVPVPVQPVQPGVPQPDLSFVHS